MFSFLPTQLLPSPRPFLPNFFLLTFLGPAESRWYNFIQECHDESGPVVYIVLQLALSHSWTF